MKINKGFKFMLELPNDSINTVNIIGIDPGTVHLGVSVISIDAETREISGSIAFTIDASKLNKNSSWLIDTYGDRFSRIDFLTTELLDIFISYNPLIICAESPFFGLRHPSAFQALTEVICAIRNTVYKFDPWRTLRLVSPSEVKQAVFAKGNATKITVKDSIRELLTELKYTGNIPFDSLDEHSIDALAIGYYVYKNL